MVNTKQLWHACAERGRDDERADALLDAGRASGRAPASADREWLRRVLKLVRRHGDALRAYRPEPYDGELVHVRAAVSAKRLERPEVSGWAALCRGAEVTIVAGDHLSIHFPPQVEAMTEVLRPALERADSLLVRQASRGRQGSTDYSLPRSLTWQFSDNSGGDVLGDLFDGARRRWLSSAFGGLEASDLGQELFDLCLG